MLLIVERHGQRADGDCGRGFGDHYVAGQGGRIVILTAAESGRHRIRPGIDRSRAAAVGDNGVVHQSSTHSINLGGCAVGRAVVGGADVGEVDGDVGRIDRDRCGGRGAAEILVPGKVHHSVVGAGVHRGRVAAVGDRDRTQI